MPLNFFIVSSKLKLTDEKIVQVGDKSPFGRNLFAGLDTAPMLNRYILGGAPSALFDGTSAMQSSGEVLNANWGKLIYVIF